MTGSWLPVIEDGASVNFNSIKLFRKTAEIRQQLWTFWRESSPTVIRQPDTELITVSDQTLRMICVSVCLHLPGCRSLSQLSHLCLNNMIN